MLLVERSDGKFLVITSLPNDYYISKLVVFYAMAMGAVSIAFVFSLHHFASYHKIAPQLQTLIQSLMGGTSCSKI